MLVAVDQGLVDQLVDVVIERLVDTSPRLDQRRVLAATAKGSRSAASRQANGAGLIIVAPPL